MKLEPGMIVEYRPPKGADKYGLPTRRLVGRIKSPFIHVERLPQYSWCSWSSVIFTDEEGVTRPVLLPNVCLRPITHEDYVEAVWADVELKRREA